MVLKEEVVDLDRLVENNIIYKDSAILSLFFTLKGEVC